LFAYLDDRLVEERFDGFGDGAAGSSMRDIAGDVRDGFPGVREVVNHDFEVAGK
jgi:hypothetical protein